MHSVDTEVQARIQVASIDGHHGRVGRHTIFSVLTKGTLSITCRERERLVRIRVTFCRHIGAVLAIALLNIRVRGSHAVNHVSFVEHEHVERFICSTSRS